MKLNLRHIISYMYSFPCSLYDIDGDVTSTLNLFDHFFNPTTLYTPGKIDAFLRGLSRQLSQMSDNKVSNHLTELLFKVYSL